VECSLPSQSWLATNLAVTACLVKPITASQLQERMTQIGNVADLLVIDDDRGFCRLVRRMVRSNGWRGTVRQAFDGEEGLRLMREQPPDLVLLDLVMPRLDGFEVLGEMQQDPTLAKIAVILLTSSSYAEDALSQQGGDLVVHRPGGLRPAEVLRSVEVLAAVLEPTYDERTPLADSGLAEP
jgi:CheY-like chemotaxis protein